VAATEPRYSKEQFARRGDTIYERDIRPGIEAGHKGEFVAIDIETGAYEADAYELAASDRLLARLPDAQIWLRRVGSRYAHRFRSHMRSAFSNHNLQAPILPVAAFLALSSLTTGCAGQPPQQPPQNGVVRITPCELFTGELKRLEPHLGLTSGCVKLDYNGPAVPIKLRVEVWKNGKVAGEAGILGTTLSGPGEASISLKEATDSKGQAKYQVVMVLSKDNGYLSFTSQVDVPRLKGQVKSRGPKQLGEPVELSKDKSVAVWSFEAREAGGMIDGNESVDATAKRVEWALVFKLSLED